MELSSTNGNPSSARQALDAMRQVVENLEAELTRQQEEIKQLRKERDEYRSVVYDHLKKQFDPKDWDDFDPKDYTMTIDDLLAIIDSK
jgi:predicted RNase H-like nuclease (RuvC/YqgF family)